MWQLVLAFLLCAPSFVWSADYLVGMGTAFPFHSARGHVTRDVGVSVDATQYLYASTWGKVDARIGVREVLWYFPTVNGVGGGVGPAGELRYPLSSVNLFVNASGSAGGWNLAKKFPETNGTRMFSGQVGVGVEFNHLRIEIRYQHLSNGHETKNNGGLDMITPMISWGF